MRFLISALVVACAWHFSLGIGGGTQVIREPLGATEISTQTVEAVVAEPVTEVHEIDWNSRLTIYVEPEPEPVVEVAYTEPTYTTDNDGWIYYGTCTVTYYCPAECCCGAYASGYTASGTKATANRTVAMSGMPFGTHILVNGQEYIVEDRGVSGMWVDIFVNTHDEAIQRGMHSAEVYYR